MQSDAGLATTSEVVATTGQGTAKPRRAWLAAILALLFPGLGHLYVGRPMLSVLFIFVPRTALTAILLVAVFQHAILLLTGIGVVVLFVAMRIVEISWAYRLARQNALKYERVGTTVSLFTSPTRQRLRSWAISILASSGAKSSSHFGFCHRRWLPPCFLAISCTQSSEGHYRSGIVAM